MRHLARQFLRFFLVAVAVSASGLNGYAAVMAAFDTHVHGPHALHEHPAYDHGVTAHADHTAPDGQLTLSCAAACDEQSSPCEHMHAHACSSVAVTANECVVKFAHYARETVPVANSHLPHGQLSSPLFRPPRAA